MAPRRSAIHGHDIDTYRARRDFSATAEPPPSAAARPGIFVIQKHDATRLHWDFRLEHGGVLWSWAVPRGPSLDPHDKRLAVHVEDHPVDYAEFHGTIPAGQYGAGTVEIWDSGTWQAVASDPAEAMRQGEIKFVLDGTRLQGRFVLVKLKPRPKERAENWLLIKEHDEHEREGADAAVLEAEIPPPATRRGEGVWNSRPKNAPSVPAIAGSVKAVLPETLAPQLATLVDAAPEEPGWIAEVKFDGYRIIAIVAGGRARLITRNGHDWTDRLRSTARAVERLKLADAVLDGELVALRENGISNFADLQDALSTGHHERLFYYLFDLLHLNGQDLRGARLEDRKAALKPLSNWRGTLRFSDHVVGEGGRMRRSACAMGLEGIICKQLDAPYRSGRGRSWLKVKCQGRDEFLVLGWTPPAGSRTGFGALHVGYHDNHGGLHYAGGVGTGFSDKELTALKRRLAPLATERPAALLFAGDPIEARIQWVRPELVVEVQYLAWTGAGRLRHAAYLGLREDKVPEDVILDPIADPEVERRPLGAGRTTTIVRAAAPSKRAVSPAAVVAVQGGAPVAVTARAPRALVEEIAGVRITHPERELWPGITKRDLATYWATVAEHALPEIAGRPLALVRCPDGIAGEHFFQKHAKIGFPGQIRAGDAEGAPYLVIDDVAGLVAAAQVSAIELHAWGAAGTDPLHPDRLIFDLDPGDGITIPDIVAAALDVRRRLEAVGLASFCRTSGGKGLHVVVPLMPRADWDTARAWCRAFAERMEMEDADKYVASVPKARRHGRILVDWLRNGLGSTAVASLSPRARPGAGVATRLSWAEVKPALDPAAFTLASVPGRLAKQKGDPWPGFVDAARPLPITGTERTATTRRVKTTKPAQPGRR